MGWRSLYWPEFRMKWWCRRWWWFVWFWLIVVDVVGRCMAFVVLHQNTKKMRTGNNKYIRILARLHLRNTCAYMTFSSHFDKVLCVFGFYFFISCFSCDRRFTVSLSRHKSRKSPFDCGNFPSVFFFLASSHFNGKETINLRCITWPVDTTFNQIFFYSLCTDIILSNRVDWKKLHSPHFFRSFVSSKFVQRKSLKICRLVANVMCDVMWCVVISTRSRCYYSQKQNEKHIQHMNFIIFLICSTLINQKMWKFFFKKTISLFRFC